MFAIVYAVCNFVAKTRTFLKNNYTNHLARKKAIGKGNFAYWDANGAYRLTSNNQQIRFVNLKNGDRTIQTLDGTIIRNITKESRESNMKLKNKELDCQAAPVRMVGTFYDVCPDKYKKGKWFYINKRAAVFKDKEGNLYFREPTFHDYLCKYSYISVNEGRYTFLKTPTDKEEEWLNEKNKALDMGFMTRIHLSNFVELL